MIQWFDAALNKRLLIAALHAMCFKDRQQLCGAILERSLQGGMAI